jgi:DNA sulfur modification protein DndD
MEGLQLLKLRIENYRQYKGVNEIDLSTDGRRHINVIQGENGTGKSNLLNAVTLCLFGDEMHQENNVEEDAILPYVSLDLIEDLSQGEAAEGMIEIEIGHEEPEYIFTRRFRTFSVGKGYNDVKDDLQVKRKSGKDWETEENPITTRNEIIPVRVASYFFFDGEQLSEFFNQGYQDRVKEAILDISHIQLLDRSLYHLNQMRSDIQSTARDYGGRPEEIQQEIESI